MTASIEQKAADGFAAIQQIVKERDALQKQCATQENVIARLQAINETIERQHTLLVAERDHYMKQTMLLMSQINNVASIANQVRDESRSIIRDIVGPRGQSSEELTRELEAEMPKFIESIRSNGTRHHDG